MKKFLFVFFLLTTAYFAQAQELWTSFETETLLTRKISVDATAEARWQQFDKPLKTIFGELGVSYKIIKPLSIGVSYRFAQRNREQGFFTVHSFATRLAYRYRIGNFRIQYRNKFETDKDTYIKDEEDLRWHFTDRNRIKISYYKKATLLSPSVFIESFNEISAQEAFSLSELRYGVGLDFMLYRGYSIGIGGVVKQEFGSKTEFTYAATLALVKEF
ncbi:MAG: DUF2490 domain-containing protein [Bacteroidales bacterium]|jgi:mRNA-degrading endonuclease RelE of RelBE toxin-antitoxin system|nr:DUF2490 domain-containing protein [Bacteroidales bacterium]